METHTCVKLINVTDLIYKSQKISGLILLMKIVYSLLHFQPLTSFVFVQTIKSVPEENVSQNLFINVSDEDFSKKSPSVNTSYSFDEPECSTPAEQMRLSQNFTLKLNFNTENSLRKNQI